MYKKRELLCNTGASSKHRNAPFNYTKTALPDVGRVVRALVVLVCDREASERISGACARVCVTHHDEPLAFPLNA